MKYVLHNPTRIIFLYLLFFTPLLMISCGGDKKVSAFTKAKFVKLEILTQKFNVLQVLMDNLDEKIIKKEELLEEMQGWPDRDEDQERIIENLIEELKEEQEGLKTAGDELGKESKVVKGTNKREALRLIDKNFREEIARLRALKQMFIDNAGLPGNLLLAEEMDRQMARLEELLREASEEVVGQSN